MKPPALLSFVLLVAAPVCAELKRGDHIFMGNLGLTVPGATMDFQNIGGGEMDIGNTGGAVGLQYHYQFTPMFGLGLDLNYSATGEESSTELIPRGNTTAESESSVTLIIARFNFRTNTNTIPFAFVGLGGHSTRLHMTSIPSTGYVWSDTGTTEQRTIIDEEQTSSAFGLGAGLDHYLSPRFFLGFEGRFVYLGESTFNTTASGALLTGASEVKSSFGMFNIVARIGLRFGPGGNVQPASEEQAAAPTAAAISDRQKAHDFIVSGYQGITADLQKGSGSYLSSLQDLLKIPASDRPESTRKIKALSEAYPNIAEFADHVVDMYFPNKPSGAQPKAPQPKPTAPPSKPAVGDGVI